MTLLIKADARFTPLKDESVHCVVTSPPYWGLRKYDAPELVWGGEAKCWHEWGEFERPGISGGTASDKVRIKGKDNFQIVPPLQQGICRFCGAWRGQLGLEPTPELYVQHLVKIFREVHRVLKEGGTVWLNLGDSYTASPKGSLNGSDKSGLTSTRTQEHAPIGINKLVIGLKSKDLVGIPWLVAFALRNDGWYLRSDIIWSKANPMPESVTDRPTRSHEYLFLLSKSQKYHYDADAIREPSGYRSKHGSGTGRPRFDEAQMVTAPSGGVDAHPLGRNKRSVWTVATQPIPYAHFATFPEKLIEPCILAGCPQGGMVLDPFVGSGTTVRVAEKLNRRGIGLDLAYQEIGKVRTSRVQRRLKSLQEEFSRQVGTSAIE